MERSSSEVEAVPLEAVPGEHPTTAPMHRLKSAFADRYHLERALGDAVVLRVQEWLREHYPVASPVEEMVKLSGMPARSFKRRFGKATGYTPITYVQHLRIEEAKRRLERTDASIDKISWSVGYEDPTAFRRLFKRITRMTPGAYRRKFRPPDLAAAGRRNRRGSRSEYPSAAHCDV